ncbi:MAG TPA: PqqD family peptide modification chaperone [Acidimicrobiales bacterium]|nr:PqqD family peptide modification chaperone [Acidimicrobiales bacterium]
MKIVVSHDEVVLREQEGDAFLLHVPSGRYFGLNRSGLVIWQAVLDGRDPLEALAERWPDVPAERRQADADALITALVGAGLAQAVEDRPGS